MEGTTVADEIKMIYNIVSERITASTGAPTYEHWLSDYDRSDTLRQWWQDPDGHFYPLTTGFNFDEVWENLSVTGKTYVNQPGTAFEVPAEGFWNVLIGLPRVIHGGSGVIQAFQKLGTLAMGTYFMYQIAHIED